MLAGRHALNWGQPGREEVLRHTAIQTIQNRMSCTQPLPEAYQPLGHDAPAGRATAGRLSLLSGAQNEVARLTRKLRFTAKLTAYPKWPHQPEHRRASRDMKAIGARRLQRAAPPAQGAELPLQAKQDEEAGTRECTIRGRRLQALEQRPLDAQHGLHDIGRQGEKKPVTHRLAFA